MFQSLSNIIYILCKQKWFKYTVLWYIYDLKSRDLTQYRLA